MIGGLLVLFVSNGSSLTPTPAVHNNCRTDCTSNDERTACSVCKCKLFFSPTPAIHNNCHTDCTSNDERTACSVCKYWFYFYPYSHNLQQLWYRSYL